MAFAILSEQGAAKGVAGAMPPAPSGFAEVARIVAQYGGKTGMNGSINGESGPMAARALENPRELWPPGL
jgi:hypothetical protein